MSKPVNWGAKLVDWGPSLAPALIAEYILIVLSELMYHTIINSNLNSFSAVHNFNENGF